MNSFLVPSRRVLLTMLSSLTFALPVTTSAQSAAATTDRVAGWRSDIAFWVDQVKKQHYVYKSKPLPPALLKAAEDLSKNIPRYSDDRMLFEMTRLSSYAGDGHTYVLPLAAQRFMGSVIPIRFYLFSDGMFVIDAKPGYEKWIGSELIALANTPTAKVIERMKPAISSDNKFGYKWIGPPFLNLKGIIEAVTEQQFTDSIPVTLRDRNGKTQHVKFVTGPPPRMEGVPKLLSSRLAGAPPAPLWLRDVRRNFWMAPQGDGSLYVQFNQVANDEGHTLRQAGAELDSVLSRTHPAKIILDVRHNNGGNSYLYPPIIDALSAWETAVPAGKLYVITGRNTFSAAQNFITQLDKRTRAIFVGEPSSSKPNFVGEENDLQLPWSGAIISISNRYHENIPGDTRPWIEPEIRIDLSSKDYFANRDPVLARLSR
jgi:phosphoglycolate phosphatase-like HAD superfamily hydrolase